MSQEPGPHQDPSNPVDRHQWLRKFHERRTARTKDRGTQELTQPTRTTDRIRTNDLVTNKNHQDSNQRPWNQECITIWQNLNRKTTYWWRTMSRKSTDVPAIREKNNKTGIEYWYVPLHCWISRWPLYEFFDRLIVILSSYLARTSGKVQWKNSKE